MRRWIRSTEGYLLVDHQNSPGLPDNFLRDIGLGGLGPQRGMSEGSKFEAPTLTCAHCGTVAIMNPKRTRDRGFCRKCYQYICDKPQCHLECKPYQGRWR